MAGTQEGGRKASEGGRGNPEKASPAAVERYLKGIHFPTSKDDILKQAQENGAPEDVINVINQFQDEEFNSPVDIAKAVGEVE